MKTVNIDLGERSYDINIGHGLIADPAMYLPAIAGQQVLIVSNEVVAPLYLDAVSRAVAQKQCHTLVLPDGEDVKTLQTANLIFDKMLSIPCDRQATVIALGGGVIGDMAGFAAACYQRGVPFIQVPTTLLAQVDSSVGGKTAVNHPLGKNMIGAFYQPQTVIADTSTLDTLDDRQFAAGLAEVIKYGAIDDLEFFDWLAGNMAAILDRDADAIAFLIERSCLNKARIVALDEREGGIRALLNLGHTFGHAIEAGLGYGVWLHGEAIATGMSMAADLSLRMGMMDAEQAAGIDALLKAAGLPITPFNGVTPDEMIEHMTVDKKVLAGQVRLVLLSGIGKAEIVTEYPQELFRQTLEKYCLG